MDHSEAIQSMSAEKYLLDELSPEAREQFEDHFFGCTECALDVRTGAALVEQMKVGLSEPSPGSAVQAPVPVSGKSGWFGWLRPALVLPVLAALVVLIGYQNLVIYPKLQMAANAPQVLPWATVSLNNRGANAPIVTAQPGRGFLLFVNVPTEGHYSSYRAELHDPAGSMEWSLSIPAVTADDSWPIRVPDAPRQQGTYTLVVLGVGAAGEQSEIGRGQFELHIQK